MKYVLILLLLAACAPVVDTMETQTPTQSEPINTEVIETQVMAEEKVAVFAGGCFWCSEAAFQELEGVSKVISGYAGGTVENPTYEQVGTGTTGHKEAVEVHYNPDVVSYEQLLETYWTHIDPTDNGGQFADRGSQYETAVFYRTEEEKELAEQTKQEIIELFDFDDPVVTQILPYTNFYPAEDYHQDYYLKAPTRYKTYAKFSGRETFIKETYSD